LVPPAAVGAKGTPVNVGATENTASPVPVSSEIDDNILADVILLAFVLYNVFVPEGIVALDAAVEVNVVANAPLVINELPSINVSVALVVGAVTVTLFIVVAAATPKTGVTRVGEVENTETPVPVSFVRAVDKFADVNEPNDATLPVEVTIPVRFALVAFALVTNAVVAI